MLLPFFTHTSGFVAAPGTVILAAGVLLVVMSAFFESTRGVGKLPGWRIRFGKAHDSSDDDASSLPEEAPNPTAPQLSAEQIE